MFRWILIFCVLLPGCIAARAEPSIFFDGLPVELKISEVSARTIRIELAPLDNRGVPHFADGSPILVDFPAKERFRARQLDGKRKFGLEIFASRFTRNG